MAQLERGRPVQALRVSVPQAKIILAAPTPLPIQHHQPEGSGLGNPLDKSSMQNYVQILAPLQRGRGVQGFNSSPSNFLASLPLKGFFFVL